MSYIKRTYSCFFQGFYDVLRRNSQLASSIMQTLFAQVCAYIVKTMFNTMACFFIPSIVKESCCAHLHL